MAMVERTRNGMLAGLLAADAHADFLTPPGAAALCPADGVSWRVFANPVALFVGGVAAVILELAEPRVRTGVWQFSDFRRDPAGRMRRTGMAALVTVYAARERAEPMIEQVNRMHAGVRGVTPGGEAFCANDPELLDWVQATASFGFVEAYHAYCRALSAEEKDRFYAEGAVPAALYGARNAPGDVSGLEALFARMLPKLEPSPIIGEFLAIVAAAPLLPRLLRPLQRLLIRAALDILPPPIRARLDLGQCRRLAPWQGLCVRGLGMAMERIELASLPPMQARRRLGLPQE